MVVNGHKLASSYKLHLGEGSNRNSGGGGGGVGLVDGPSSSNNAPNGGFSPQAAMQRLRKLQKVIGQPTGLLAGRSRRQQSRQKDEEGSGGIPDALLAIPGVDGNYNCGSRGLINYLFMGRSGDYINHYSFEDADREDNLDDVVLVVHPDRVSLYCNPKNYDALLPYFSLWRNCTVYCLPADKYDADPEFAEEYKIRSFVRMIQGCSVLAMCMGDDNDPVTDNGNSGGEHIRRHLTSAKSNINAPHPPTKNDADPFNVETWPLIQAYALEDFGGEGFFTMSHRVVNASSMVEREIYSVMDAEDLRYTVKKSLSKFEFHWNSMLTNVDIAATTAELDSLSQIKAAEPLFSYFRYGQLGFRVENNRNFSHGVPRLFFGAQTSKKMNADILRPDGSAYSTDAVISTAGGDGGNEKRPAVHMTCEASEPKGPLRCARSYFFPPAYLGGPQMMQVADLIEDQNQAMNLRIILRSQKEEMNVKNALQLKGIYTIMVQCVNETISHFAKTLSDNYEINQFILRRFKSLITDKLLPPSFDFSPDCVEFSLTSYNARGVQVTMMPGKAIQAVKYIRFAVLNIPSICDPSHTLGGLVFGETFLDSRVECLDGLSQSDELYSNVILLTGSVPVFVSWTNFKQAEQSINEGLKLELFPAEKLLSKLSVSAENMALSSKHAIATSTKSATDTHKLFGKVLFEDERCNVVTQPFAVDSMGTSRSSINVTNCHLCVYERAIVLEDKRSGFLLLPLIELSKESKGGVVKEIMWCAGENQDDFGLLTLKLSDEMQLPVAYQSRGDYHISLCMLPKSKGKRSFTREILTKWKKSDIEEKVSSVEFSSLPADVKSQYSQLRSYHQLIAGGSDTPAHSNSLRDLSGSSSNVNWEMHTSTDKKLPHIAGLQRTLSILEINDAHSHLPKIPQCSWDSISQVLDDNGSNESSYTKDSGGESESTGCSIPVTIITGLPGSGKSRLLSSIVNVSTENTKWIVVEQSIESGMEFNPEKTQKALSSIWKSVSKSVASSEEQAKKKQTRAVIITPGYADVVEVCRCIVNHPDVDIRSHFYIGAINACVDPSLVFVKDRMVYPAALEQCCSGFTSSVIFTKCEMNSSVSQAKLAPVLSLIKHCNPQVNFIRTKNNYLLANTADFDTILSTELFNSSPMVMQRLWLHAGWNSVDQVYHPSPIVNPFSTVMLQFSAPLDKTFLTQQLKSLMSTSFSSASPMSSASSREKGFVHRLKGKVRILTENNPSKSSQSSSWEEVEVQFNRANRVYTIHHTGTTDTTATKKKKSSSASATLSPPNTVIFVGDSAITENECKKWLSKCQKPLPKKRRIRSRGDVTNKELQTLQKKHMAAPLPEGFFFNGSQYVSFDGERLSMHPHMETFVEEYLRTLNTEAEEYNAQIDEMYPLHEPLFPVMN
eukprot:Nk52_evm11s2118 gene=Nk52_evmTU11s2118